jgi:hypothetical protein
MSTWPKIVVVALLAAALGALVADRAARADRDALAARLQRLEQRMAAQEQARVPAGGPGVADAGGDWSPAERQAAVAAAEAALAQPAKRPPPPSVESVQARHAAEPRDPVWAAGAEVALAEAAASEELAAANLVPDSIDTRCRSKSCRIVATFADAGDADDWAFGFMTHSAGTLRRVRKYDTRLPDGRVEVTFFGDR